MEKHELKARIDGQTNEWNGNLDVMRAKADAATGEAKLKYAQTVADLSKQLGDLKKLYPAANFKKEVNLVFYEESQPRNKSPKVAPKEQGKVRKP